MSTADFTGRHVLVVGQHLAPLAQDALADARFELAAGDRLDVLDSPHVAIDLVLIDAEAADAVDLVVAIASLSAKPNPPAVLLAGAHLPASLVRALMKLPRSDVIEAPFTAADLARAAGALLTAVPAAAPAPTHEVNARCWTVVGSVGGCGATTIAVELATELCQRASASQRVALVDLNLADGAAAAYLGATANMMLAEASATPERIDTALLDVFATKTGEGLDLLAAPRDPKAFAKVTQTSICRLLEMTAQVYDWIVIDLPRHHQPWTLDVLAGSDEVLVVSELTVPALLSARALASEIETEVTGGAQPRIILNRLASRMFGPAPSLAEAEKALQRKADGGITSDWEAAAASVNLGGSINHHRPRSKIVRDIGVLVDRLSQPAEDPAQARLMARFSFRREPSAEAPERLVVSDPADEAPKRAAAAPAKPAPAKPKAEPAPPPPAIKLNLMLDDDPADVGPVATDSMLDMRLRLHSKLIEEIDLSKLDKLDEGEMRRQVRRLVAEFAKTERLALNTAELDELGASVFDEMVGLGPLEPLLKDDSIADILINGPFQVYVERRGELEIAPVRFRDNDHLLRIVNRIVAGVGRRVDESSPLVDARLPDGSRVNAAIGPVAIDGAAVSIRKFSKKPYDLERLVGVGAMPAPVAEFLYGAIRSRVSTVISGGTGSGKTTLLNALSAAIRNKERLITIEDAAELQLQQPHVVRMETRPPSIEGKGEIRQRELVKNALRMRPDRVILGEVRGEEAFDMLQAMNTGHEGSMATIHANTPRDAITRLEQMVAMGGMSLSPDAIRGQIASAVGMIVQVMRLSDGKRRLTSVTEITGMEGQVVQMQEIFAFHRLSTETDGTVVGEFRATGLRPKCMDEMIRRGIRYDTTNFDPSRSLN